MIVAQARNQVQEVLHALNGAEIEYCLLRAYEEQPVEGAVQEIDLLVAADAMQRFEEVVHQHGYSSWPAWGYAPHRFYLAYDDEAGIWTKLDVVNTLQYGSPVRCLELDEVQEVLGRRQPVDGIYVLAGEDEFVTLLLHCILDKRRFRDEHRSRLLALWSSMVRHPLSRGILVQRLDECLGSQFRQVLEDAMMETNWARLLRNRKFLEGRLLRRRPLPGAWRFASTSLLRKARRLLFMWTRRGTSVALLAPDGGGKSSLAADLVRDPWLRARLVYMGSNFASTNYSLPTTRWLRDKLKSSSTPRLQKAILKPFGTVNQLLEEWYRHGIGSWYACQGHLVVYDRYIYDTYTSPRAQSLRVRARRWLVQKTCPAPDLVFFLDAPGDVLHRRKQEHSPEFLERQRGTYLGLQDAVKNFVVVDATRSREAVRREVISRIWQRRAATRA